MPAAQEGPAPTGADRPYHVRALRDAEAEVWVATSDDVPGLVAEAATIEELLDDLRSIIPDLLQLNAVPHTDRIEVNFIAERIEAIEPAA